MTRSNRPTPGPWRFERRRDGQRLIKPDGKHWALASLRGPITVGDETGVGYSGADANASLIVAAVNAVLAICDGTDRDPVAVAEALPGLFKAAADLADPQTDWTTVPMSQRQQAFDALVKPLRSALAAVRGEG